MNTKTDDWYLAMGVSMFGFYFGFVAVSLSLTYGWLTCPIEFSVWSPGQRGKTPPTAPNTTLTFSAGYDFVMEVTKIFPERPDAGVYSANPSPTSLTTPLMSPRA